jgi:hypothetical protein
MWYNRVYRSTAPIEFFFNSAAVERLIASYQATGRTETLGEVIEACRPISESIVRQRHTFVYESEDEIFSIINRKLFCSIEQYDPARGSAFSFISRLCINMCKTVVTHNRKQAARYEPFDQVRIAVTPDPCRRISNPTSLRILSRKSNFFS